MDMIRFFEIPGIGGAVALTAITTLVICYYLTLKWVAKGQEGNAGED
jgi:hypothetical protein